MKILFLIHDLGRGGAEKVLVNLVNNMDCEKFDITVMALFGGGVNEQFLSKHVKYRAVFPKNIPGNSHIMKLLRPSVLHRLFIKEHYDVEISYLEGPSARIISGCPDTNTRLVTWIHVEQKTKKKLARSFRSYKEALRCYGRFDRVICVSEGVKSDFYSLMPVTAPLDVIYNTNESEKIKELALEPVEPGVFRKDEIKIIGIGTLKKSKGFRRALSIIKRFLEEKYPVHFYLLGTGPEEQDLKQFAAENQLNDNVSFLGYQTNPYRFLKKCDLFICSSYAEGFSTATTEALIVGTPVCTTEVAGMRELLGDHGEYGLITKNDEESLYIGIKKLLDDPDLLSGFQKKAIIRGEQFSNKQTVGAVENMLLDL